MTIKELIYKSLKDITKQKFSDSSNIFEIGIDSLDLVELITEAEDKLGINIPDEEIGKIKTIQDVIELFKKYKK